MRHTHMWQKQGQAPSQGVSAQARHCGWAAWRFWAP